MLKDYYKTFLLLIDNLLINFMLSLSHWWFWLIYGLRNSHNQQHSERMVAVQLCLTCSCFLFTLQSLYNGDFRLLCETVLTSEELQIQGDLLES